jgi:hypothetical protein
VQLVQVDSLADQQQGEQRQHVHTLGMPTLRASVALGKHHEPEKACCQFCRFG